MAERRNGDTSLLVLVPDGHPLVGSQIVLYPVSGATTYVDGVLRFSSPGAEDLRWRLDELREALAAFAVTSVPVPRGE